MKGYRFSAALEAAAQSAEILPTPRYSPGRWSSLTLRFRHGETEALFTVFADETFRPSMCEFWCAELGLTGSGKVRALSAIIVGLDSARRAAGKQAIDADCVYNQSKDAVGREEVVRLLKEHGWTVLLRTQRK